MSVTCHGAKYHWALSGHPLFYVYILCWGWWDDTKHLESHNTAMLIAIKRYLCLRIIYLLLTPASFHNKSTKTSLSTISAVRPSLPGAALTFRHRNACLTSYLVISSSREGLCYVDNHPHSASSHTPGDSRFTIEHFLKMFLRYPQSFTLSLGTSVIATHILSQYQPHHLIYKPSSYSSPIYSKSWEFYHLLQLHTDDISLYVTQLL